MHWRKCEWLWLAGRRRSGAHRSGIGRGQQEDNQCRESSQARGLSIEHGSPYLLVNSATLPHCRTSFVARHTPTDTHSQMSITFRDLERLNYIKRATALTFAN